MGLAFAKDGALLISDDANGVLYRVSHEQPQGKDKPFVPPAGEMKQEVSRGVGVPLAFDRGETTPKRSDVITVSSTSLKEAKSIPGRHSEYLVTW